MKTGDLIINIIREVVPDVDQAREAIKQKAAYLLEKKKPDYVRWGVIGAIAAVAICIITFSGYKLMYPGNAETPVITDGPIIHNGIYTEPDAFLPTSSNNNFILLAFIPYQEDEVLNYPDFITETNGEWIELKDKDEFNQLIYGFWTADVIYEYEGTEPPSDFDVHNIDPSMLYNRTLHKSIFLKCEGDNIVSVKFSVDNNGFFTKANVLTQNGIPVISDNGFTIISQEELGNSFILTNPEEITGDFMLFVGKTFPDDTTLWELNLMINVIATFIDNST